MLFIRICNCTSLLSLDLSNFDTSECTTFDYMFYGCENLTSLNLSNFDTSSLLNLSNTFFGCKSLEYLDLSNFNSLVLSDIDYAFCNCESLKSLNLYNLNTSNISNMALLFYGCSSLISLNISSNFNTSKVKRMEGMFEGCESLTNLDISNFETNNVENMGHMFYNCKSLTSLNFSNFNTSEVKYMDYLFYDCGNLTILDLSSFDTSNTKNFTNMFNGCTSLKSLDISNFDTTSITEDNKFDDIFTNCENLEFINFTNYKDGTYNLKISHFQNSSKNIVICSSNNILIQEIDGDRCIRNNCEENWYDYKTKIYGNNECTDDCSTTSFKYEFKKQCYKKCPQNTSKRKNDDNINKYNINYKYFCKPECSKETPFEMVYAQECVENCNIKSILDKLCIKNYYEKESEDKNYVTILEDLETTLINGDLNTTDIENGKNKIVEFNDMTITLTTTKNQKDNENNANMTTINLGECEDILRKEYNISQDEEIIMLKVDSYQEGMKIPKIIFNVYHKINDTYLLKLDLFFCSDIKIDISIPIIINESLDKLNSSSDYYNDICYTATSDNGTDISLNDRKNEFVEKNRAVCQEKCVFAEYNYTTKKAKCSCDAVETSSSLKNIKFDKSKLFENFIDIKNIANIHLLVCYKVLFSKKGIKKNYGCFSLIPLILFHLILMILFCTKKQFKKIMYKIKAIKNAIINLKSSIFKRVKRKFPKNLNNLNNLDETKKRAIKQEERNIKPKYQKGKGNEIILQPPIYQRKNINFDNPPIKKKNKVNKKLEKKSIINKSNNNHNDDKIITIDNIDSKRKITSNNKNKKNILEKEEKALVYNDDELNDLPYEEAISYDHRTYCLYYVSLLKTNHDFIFTFVYNSDYNSKIIKIDLFIIGFILFFVMNALFFNDKTMHKIYEDEGSFDIIYQLPQIIYSSILSGLFKLLLTKLALSQELISNFKDYKNIIDIDKRVAYIKKKIIIKFVFYFIISTILLLFFWYYFWYYISMFCAIYANTQIHLIKDTIISFILSFISPIFIYLIPGFFRIPALAKHKIQRKYLYNFSKFLQMILSF